LPSLFGDLESAGNAEAQYERAFWGRRRQSHQERPTSNAVTAVLSEPGMVGHVFSLAGSKKHLFFGGVCRVWKEASQLDARQRSVSTETYLEAVVVSVACLKWVMQYFWGPVFDKRLVTAAVRSVEGAAVLQWMLDDGCVVLPDWPKHSG
ncbi:unnamed protein product, partial [Phaeothamnion confervicola]